MPIKMEFDSFELLELKFAIRHRINDDRRDWKKYPKFSKDRDFLSHRKDMAILYSKIVKAKEEYNNNLRRQSEILRRMNKNE